MAATTKYFLPCLLFLISGLAAAGRSPPIYFFENGVPDWVSATGGALTVSSDEYKDGRSSLKWSYGRGDRLAFSRPIDFEAFHPNAVDQKRSAFLGWIYSPKPQRGRYEFTFFSNEHRAASFSVAADFQGWRALVVAFEGEMQGTPTSQMDRLQVTPPAQSAGVVYFDQMVFGMPVDPRYPIPDYQVPFVNEPVRERPNAHWSALLQFDEWMRAAASARPLAPDPEVDRSIARIARKLDDDLLHQLGSLAAPNWERINAQHRRLLLQPGKFKALSETSRQSEMYRQAGVAGSQLEFLDQTTMHWADVGDFMLSLAIAHRTAGDPQERERLETMFLRITAHLANQGLVRGSGQGIMHHQGYVLGSWARALFLMRDALGEHADAAREAIAWYVGLGRIYQPAGEIVDLNVDVMNTFLREMLFAILMDTDADRRRSLLSDYSAWLSRSIVTSHGLAGGIKDDGSFFHHSQHYVAYANGGLVGLTNVVYCLSGTPFAVTPAAVRQVRSAVLMTRIFSNRGQYPMSLAGRHPDDHQYIVLDPFKYMTQVGDPDEPQAAFDASMARAYLRLARDVSTNISVASNENARRYHRGYDAALVAALVRAGYSPEEDPTGSWVMNYSSLVLHRTDGNLVAARGFSRYLVGNEAYAGQNAFGRYLNYGHLEILPKDPALRGYRQAGWDWNRWPGTTTIHLPLENLRARLSQVDQSAGIEEMLLSDETFSGGLHLRQASAMFAMKLHAHPKYPGNLRARKSVFFFGNRVIAMGSAIDSDDPDHAVETTLFQDYLRDDGLANDVSGENVVGRNFSLTRNAGAEEYVVDLNGNGFYLPAGQRLVFARQDQKSLEQDGATPSTGAFSTLVIDHGEMPRGASYEYAVLIGSGARGAHEFARAMKVPASAPYRVLEKTDGAHVVFDRQTNTTSYAVFDAGAVLPPGSLLEVSRPSMVMLREHDSVLEAAYVDPDLALYEGRDESQYDATGRRVEVSVYSRPWRNAVAADRVSYLRLAGRWHATPTDACRVTAHGATDTVVEVTSRPGSPVQFTLIKEGREP